VSPNEDDWYETHGNSPEELSAVSELEEVMRSRTGQPSWPDPGRPRYDEAAYATALAALCARAGGVIRISREEAVEAFQVAGRLDLSADVSGYTVRLRASESRRP
jgi:hypothetical protein